MTAKENAPAMTEAQSDNTGLDSTAPETPRPLFHPLTWRPEKPAKFRGKGKRRTRADAIARKRGQWGNARADLLAWLAILAAFALAGWLSEVTR